MKYLKLLLCSLVSYGSLHATTNHFLTYIIPAYNRAHTIRAAIDSIYEQRNLHIPFEVICTDDASTDETPEILREYADKYENFHAYFLTENAGASEARNTCMDHAKGDLIFNLDSDNILEPNSMAKLVDHLDKTGCEAATFFEARYFTGDKNSKGGKKYTIPGEVCTIHTMFTKHPTPPSGGNYLFTKQSYIRAGKYKGRVRETWSFGLRQLATGTKIAILPNSFYWHRVSKDSKWASYEKNHENDRVSLQIVRDDIPEIFTKETLKIFANFDVTKRKFYKDLQAGKFKLISKMALEHLFNSYRLAEEGLLPQALHELARAIESGAHHKKLYTRLK